MFILMECYSQLGSKLRMNGIFAKSYKTPLSRNRFPILQNNLPDISVIFMNNLCSCLFNVPDSLIKETAYIFLRNRFTFMIDISKITDTLT
ncbi:hypothetical protein D3C80_1874390 [compost metagenome]